MRAHPKRTNFWMILAGSGALAWAAAPAAAQQKTFEETTSVVVVEVPVTVVKDGQPVAGLTAENFEIYDGKRQRRIVGFETIDLASIAPEPGKPVSEILPVAARRHFLLLFDLSFSEPSSLLKARRAAREILDQLHPTDLVAVALYRATSGAQWVLGFTSDRPQIELALDTLGAPQLLDRSPDPLNLVLGDLTAAAREAYGIVDDEISALDGGGGGKGGAIFEVELRQFLEQASATERIEERNRVVAMTRSLGDLARTMAGRDGRKYVVYLSEGFDASLMVAETTDDLSTTDSIASGEIWNVDSTERMGDTRLQNDFEQMLEEFRRADCIVQAVDIGGLRGSGDVRPRASGQTALFAMANDTGGELYRNFNNLGEAMGRMLQKTSVSYMLAFQPEDLKLDGSYHKLRVKLVGVEGGLRVEHRTGYYEPKPFTQMSAVERQLGAAGQVLAGAEGGPLAPAVIAAPFRVPGEPAYVPVLIEIDGKSLLAGAQGGNLGAEVYAYALDEAGGVHDLFFQAMGLDLAKVGPALQQTGIKFYGHLDLAPGRYTVRVLVRNAATGASGLRVVALEVPGPESTGPLLLPPLFLEPMGKWLVVRESEAQQKERSLPYPFMLGSDPFIPAARPEVTASGEARLCIAGYGLADGAALEARVVGADGRPVRGGRLEVVERGAGAMPGVAQLIARFWPEGLPPGDYRLEVTVRDDATGGAGSSAIPIRVAKG